MKFKNKISALIKATFKLVPKSVKIILILFYILSLLTFSYANFRTGSNIFELFISDIILSVPLVILFFSIAVIVAAIRQRRDKGYVYGTTAEIIYRIPRIAGILITIFVGLFSLDVFSEGGNIWEMLLAFIIHSIPSVIMTIVLIIAWKRDWVGFVIFSLVSIFFMRILLFDPLQALGMLLLFSGPTAVIAFMFWINWKWKEGGKSN